MAYEKTTWETGDTITAEKLNNLENGVAGNVFIIGEETVEDITTLDKTWEDILTALSGGSLCIIMTTDTNYANVEFVKTVYVYDDDPEDIIYGVQTIDKADYTTVFEDGYPATTGGK